MNKENHIYSIFRKRKEEVSFNRYKTGLEEPLWIGNVALLKAGHLIFTTNVLLEPVFSSKFILLSIL